MICKRNIDDPICCCIKPREILLAWGYAKLAITCVSLLCSLLPLGAALVIFMFYSGWLELITFFIYAALNSIWIIDIVLTSIFVHGVHKRKVKLIKKYYTYTKVLWVLIPVLCVIFAIISLNSHAFFSASLQYEDNLIIIVDLGIMLVSLIFQTCAIILGRREVEKLGNIGSVAYRNECISDDLREFNEEITIKIENPNTEKEEDSDSIVEELDTTCEKAKLTED